MIGRPSAAAVEATVESLVDDDGPSGSKGPPSFAVQAYGRYRSVADLELLTEALVAPSVWRLTAAVDQPHAFVAWRPVELDALSRVLPGVMDPTPSPDDTDAQRQAKFDRLTAVTQGRQALVDACRCTITWIRALEDAGYYRAALGIETLDGILTAPSAPDHDLGDPVDRVDVRRKLHDLFASARTARDAAMGVVLTARTRDATPTLDCARRHLARGGHPRFRR